MKCSIFRSHYCTKPVLPQSHKCCILFQTLFTNHNYSGATSTYSTTLISSLIETKTRQGTVELERGHNCFSSICTRWFMKRVICFHKALPRFSRGRHANRIIWGSCQFVQGSNGAMLNHSFGSSGVVVFWYSQNRTSPTLTSEFI